MKVDKGSWPSVRYFEKTRKIELLTITCRCVVAVWWIAGVICLLLTVLALNTSGISLNIRDSITATNNWMIWNVLGLGRRAVILVGPSILGLWIAVLIATIAVGRSGKNQIWPLTQYFLFIINFLLAKNHWLGLRVNDSLDYLERQVFTSLPSGN